MKNKLLIIIVVCILLLTLLIVVASMIKPRQKVESADAVPTSIPTTFPVTTISVRSKTISVIPTLQTDQGGINPQSVQAQASQREIKKITRTLPFEKEVMTSKGIKTSIVIPSADLQDNTWSLYVQIFGIDYNVPESSNDYVIMKQAFRESAQEVFTWLQKNGVDLKSIIIVWGDRKFIQNRAEEWLK
jgi:hypothetical protein